MILDAGEIVLFDDQRTAGDTFIFEPSSAEMGLGSLFVAIETGSEKDPEASRHLIDQIVSALQREYYRDPTRGMLPSLESALHQVNLVLHEAVEEGRREWMGSLSAAVGALAGTTLHVSTAGEGIVLLARQGSLTPVSAGLSHSPITDPLRTFAQVASGVVSEKDTLFLGTSALAAVFRPEDLTRLTIDQKAATIATRLRQLYEDQRSAEPLAVLVVSLLPESSRLAANAGRLPDPARAPVGSSPHLTPRQPLLIHSSLVRRVFTLLGRMLLQGWRVVRQAVWPWLLHSSRRGGGALYQASRAAGRNVKDITARAAPRIAAAPRRIKWTGIRLSFRQLPTSSKLFAVLVVVLSAALLISLLLLQQKRGADADIARASELLHEAQTKKDAAETALIYDNRDQARGLLQEAGLLADQLRSLQLYQEEAVRLTTEIGVIEDRLNKVVRAAGENLTEVGDFAAVLGQADLTRLFYLENSLYTFKPDDNTLARLDAATGSATVVSRTNKGIGFFTVGTAHEADKSLVLMTDSPGAALYDAKAEVVQKQEMTFPAAAADITSVAAFGNRLYIYDAASHEIYGYSKTLRGYSGGTAWIADPAFPKDSITSIGVDGYIYTLHRDGTIRKLLKGVPVDFTQEKLPEPLAADATLTITEILGHLYVFDPVHKRVVIYDTVGNLRRQIFLAADLQPKDIAVSPDEQTLYVLNGTKVQAISLAP